MKYAFIALSVILFTSCQPEHQASVAAEPTPAVAPAAEVRPSIQLGVTSGLLSGEAVEIDIGLSYTNQVLASDCFKNKVLAALFTENNGLTNQQIYDLISSEKKVVGVTIFNGTIWQDDAYHTEGYDVGDGIVYANRYYINTAYLMGDVLIHEWAHQWLFTHYYVKATSVPYQFNGFYENCLPQ